MLSNLSQSKISYFIVSIRSLEMRGKMLMLICVLNFNIYDEELDWINI